MEHDAAAHAAAPPAGPGGPGSTQRPRLLQPLRRPRRHRLWHPPGFGQLLRQGS